MKRNLPTLLAIVCSMAVLCACGPANQLLIPGEISRPPMAAPRPPAVPLPVAVADFSYDAPDAGAPRVIGRDYDRVRQVVWDGMPAGRAMADLVAGAFADRGVPASRLKPGDPVPDNVSCLVSGTVKRFEVSVRRRNVASVVIEAAVSLSLSAAGRDIPAPRETTVTSSASQQVVLPVANDYRKVLEDAANAAADEGVRRLQELGVAGTSR